MRNKWINGCIVKNEYNSYYIKLNSDEVHHFSSLTCLPFSSKELAIQALEDHMSFLENSKQFGNSILINHGELGFSISYRLNSFGYYKASSPNSRLAYLERKKTKKQAA